MSKNKSGLSTYHEFGARMLLAGLTTVLIVLSSFAMASAETAISIKEYDQQNPHTIYLLDKDLWFVTWEDSRNLATTGKDIYGQFISPDGSLCGSEFIITSSLGNQTVPKAAYRQADGKIVVVWQDTRVNYIYFNTITAISTTTCASTVGSETAISYHPETLRSYDSSTLTTATATETIASGDCETTAFGGSLSNNLVVPGTVTVSVVGGNQSLSDDSKGGLTGSGSGSINYNSGSISPTFSKAPGSLSTPGCTLGDPGPPPCTCTPQSISVTYDYYTSFPAGKVDGSNALVARQLPRIVYDSTGDRFWLVWKETRDVLHGFSTLCFESSVSHIADWSFDDPDFIGYVRLSGTTLAEQDSIISTAGADIIRNADTFTERLISGTKEAFKETKDFESFQVMGNPDVSCDSTSTQCMIVFEGRRMKQSLSCDCTDRNSNQACDLADVVTDSLVSTSFDDGFVHIYGISHNQIPLATVTSMKLDSADGTDAHYPSIGFDPVSKRFLAAWEDLRGGANTKVYGQIVQSGGGKYNSDFIISYEDTNSDGENDANVVNSKQTKPFVSYDPVNQRFFVVWQDGRNGSQSTENLDIYGQKIDGDGSREGGNFALFTQSSNQWNPTVAYNDLNNVFLGTWKDARNLTKNTCGAGANKPCGADVYGQTFTLGQPSLTLLKMDNTALTPPLLSSFENPAGTGSVEAGLFASQSIKVRNTGDTTLKIDYIDQTCKGALPDVSPFSFDGLPSQLTARDSNTIDLTPSAELTLTVRFSPSNGGSYNKCFVIESDGGNPQVNLSALSIESNAGITPTTWDFGSVYVGSFGEKTFVVQNTGTATLRIFPPDAPNTPFTIQSDGCAGQNIAPGSTCNIVVRFTPTATGPFIGFNFGVNSNDPDTPKLLVPISGTALGAAHITVAPANVDFGDVQVTQSAQLTITIGNNGTAALSISGITSPTTPFSIFSNNCPATLAVSATCQIVTEFAPPGEGTTSSNFTISSNDPVQSIVTVGLGGKGVTEPAISVNGETENPVFVSFQNTAVGQTRTTLLTVINPGTANLIVSGLTNPTGDFSIVGNTCGNVAPAGSCTISIAFKPAAAGYKTSEFDIVSNCPEYPVFTVKLSGTGSTGALGTPNINIYPNPPSFDFGKVHHGRVARRVLNIWNDGDGEVKIDSVGIPGTPFRIESNTCDKPLAPGEECKIAVVFNPASYGTFDPYSFSIKSNDPDQPDLKVTLKGEGVPGNQEIFGDVLENPAPYWSYSFIEGIYNNGITAGCAYSNGVVFYCPDSPVTRAGMAVFIIRAMGEKPSTVAYNVNFDDITDDGFAGFINRMDELGITAGCGSRAYCPSYEISRAEMAVFMIVAMGESPSGVPYNAYFDDIANNGFAGFINRMAELGITGGCGTRMYCPGSSTKRDQMAVFLFESFIDLKGLLY